MEDLRAFVGHVNNPLLEIIKDAHSNYSLWRKFNVAKLDPEKLDTMNRYVLFWKSSIRSYLLTLIISLYKLYDRNPKTKNFNKLLGLARKEGAFPKTDLRKLEVMFSRAKMIWEKVRILRNDSFAHLRYNLDDEELWKKADLSPNELKELIDISLEMFNIVRYQYGEGELPLISFDYDVDKLFEHLKIGFAKTIE